MSSGDPIPCDEWRDRLQQRFFTPEFAGEPVMFFVDDDCLAELSERDSGTASKELATTVRGMLSQSQPRRLFRRIEHATVDWQRGGGEGAPPCLPLLALCVLAASRMRRSRQYAANNYYDRFVHLLDTPFAREDIVASYAESVPRCWKALEWWLDERHAGGLGYSTIAEDPRFTNIGYADSQTLFTSSDQAKLGQFLQWMGYMPGEPCDEAELLASFKLWAARRTDLSVGAELMASSETHVPQLARILVSAARRWSGAVVADDGRQQAAIKVVLDTFPAIRVSLFAERPEGFPPEAPFESSGETVSLKASHPGWYDQLPLDASATVLRRGLRLVSGRYALAFSGGELHVLGKRPELGWASVSHLTPATPHWLLVVAPRIAELKRYLRAVARDEWEVAQAPGMPEGWVAISDVQIDSRPDEETPGWLEKLVPKITERVAFAGGLPISRARRVYLTLGEPDLWLPPGDMSDEQLRFDGSDVKVPHGARRIRLAEHKPSPGDHRVSLGPIDLAFSTRRTLGRIEARLEDRIGHTFAASDGAYLPTGGDARSVFGSPGTGEVWVLGASILGQDEDVPAPTAMPLLLRRGAVATFLLGARPGEVEEAQAPEPTEWMTEAGLRTPFFEVELPFTVSWIVTQWRSDPVHRTQLVTAIEPRPTDSVDDPSRVSRWCSLVTHAPPPSEREASALWEQYRAVAARVNPGHESVSPWRSAPAASLPRRTPRPTGDRRRGDQAGRWDLLLEWQSEVAEGTYAALSAAVEWLFEAAAQSSWQPTAAQAARLLSTLGHIEVDWQAGRWSIAPTTLARLPLAGAHALLTGSRTRPLAAKLAEVADDRDSQVYIARHKPADGPTAVFIAADGDPGLKWFADQLDARYEYGASERIVQLLPELDSYLLAARAAAMPARYGVSRFHIESLRFRVATSDHEPGLYRYETLGGAEYRLVDDAGEIFALDRARAIYACLARWGENILKFMADPVNGTLVVPMAAPLPDLQARAVALCSGLAPSRRGRTLCYANVPRRLAERVAWSLDQSLRDLR
jgi:hypothetical protein